ncbi:hypothetical protein ACFXTO_044292 [Malus domestica]
MHSRLGPQRSIHSRLGSYSDSQHEQPSGQSVYSQLSHKECPPPHIRVGSTTDGEKQSLNPVQVQPAACEELARLLGTHHMHCIRCIDEPNTWKSSLDQQVMTGAAESSATPNKGKFRKKQRDS